MPRICTVTEFFEAPGVLLDTRSPGEFAAGHIPGAISFPLFEDEERAAVGTCYKHEGQAAAIELGLELVGPKLATFVRKAKELAPDGQIRLHCWRGGMRSSSMAWLLETAGLQVSLLKGGYKAFRRWIHGQLAIRKPIVTLGGMTGTGKTEMLYALAEAGEQILDLEKYAHHRGSSYGALGLPPQPTQEQFDNWVGWAWSKLSADRPIWIEAESRRIGLCRVPDTLYQPMLLAPIVQIERSRAERIEILLAEYGKLDREDLITATRRISRKIGGQNANTAIAAIQQGDLATAIELVLNYYDKTYLYDLQRRGSTIYPVDLTGFDRAKSVQQLIAKSREVLESPIVRATASQPA